MSKAQDSNFLVVVKHNPNISHIQVKFICSRIKKRRRPRVKIVTLKLCGVWKKADIAYMDNTPHVPLRQNAEE